MHSFAGDHAAIGQQIGETFREQIQQACQETLDHPPPLPPETVSQFLTTGWNLFQQHFPNLAEELTQQARGAAVPLRGLFLTSCEELWDQQHADTGCTDIFARGPATLSGGALLGHNNDETAADSCPELVELKLTGGPTILGVFPVGLSLAVGVNSAGIVLSGTQQTARDVKPGIPRALLARAALDSHTLEQAVDICLHPSRASSYDNLLVGPNGRAINIEGSASRARVSLPGSLFAHTNHYLEPQLRQLEIPQETAPQSRARLHQATELLKQGWGRHTQETFQEILAAHQEAASVCRHAASPSETETCFSLIVEVQERRFWYCPGPPCQGTYTAFNY